MRVAVRELAEAWRAGPAGDLAAATGVPLPLTLVKDSQIETTLVAAHIGGDTCRDGIPPAWLGLAAPFMSRCHERLAQGWPGLIAAIERTARDVTGNWVAQAVLRLPQVDVVERAHQAAAALVNRAGDDVARIDAELAELAAKAAVIDADAAASYQVTASILTEIDVRWRAHVEDLYRQIDATTDHDEIGRLTLAVLLAHHCRDRIVDHD